MARKLAWLGEHGLVTTLENGSTPRYRATPRPRRGRAPAVEVEGNRAAVYLLTAPLPSPLPTTVTGRSTEVDSHPTAVDRRGRPAAGPGPAQGRVEPGSTHRDETPPPLSLWERK